MPLIRPLVAACLLFATAGAQAAMQLDPHGLGQVLIFPYYSVNAGQASLVSISNTTEHAKLLTVRFREGVNSQEVLLFNVALAAHDSWTSAIFAIGEGAALLTGDGSCTNPSLKATELPKLPDGRPYVGFRNNQYLGDSGSTSLARTREGFIEVLEIGELPANEAQQAAARDCDGISAWAQATSAPGGGLYGAVSVVNAIAGTYFSEPVTAIDGFATSTLWSPSGVLPSLSLVRSGLLSNDVSVTVQGKNVALNYPTAQGIDAVSALLMAENLIGDFVVEPSSGANTEWVVTQPTKGYYTNGAAAPLAPYTERFGLTRPLACSPYVPKLWDREQVAITPARTTPAPSGTARPDFALCYGVDVLQFGTSATPSPVLGSQLTTSLSGFVPAATSGMASLQLGHDSLVDGDAQSTLRADSNGRILRGLPVIGFQVVNYVNANVTPGVLANYAATSDLHPRASCSNAQGAAIACP